MEFNEETRKLIEGKERSYNRSEKILYLAFMKHYPGICEEKNIKYMQAGKRTYLDMIWDSSNASSAGKPLFIYIHGGGWISGSRRARKFYCRNWAKAGYVCANLGYDYALDAAHPEHLKELFKAIEYVLDNSEKYGIDSRKIVIAGESSGAYFASYIAAIAKNRALYDELGIDFKYRDSFDISANVLISGIYDIVRCQDTGFKDIELFCEILTRKSRQEIEALEEQKKALLSPESLVGPDYPPTYIISSEKDPLNSESLAFCKKLQELGIKTELFVCDAGINNQHAGALACHLGQGAEAVSKAQEFVRSKH